MFLDPLVQWFIELITKLYTIPIKYIVNYYKLFQISFQRYRLKRKYKN